MDDVNKAETDLRAAEAKLAALDAQAPTAAAAAPPATPPDATQAASTRPAPSPTATPGAPAADAAAEAASATPGAGAQVDTDRARAALLEAQSREATKRQVAFAAVQTWKDAVAAGELAADTVKEAERRLKPASVLFSKKEGRVFIRQDRKEVYEAPITFKDPVRPIGTHLFIAVNGDADGKVNWSAISVPSATIRGANARRTTRTPTRRLHLLLRPTRPRWRSTESRWRTMCASVSPNSYGSAPRSL